MAYHKPELLKDPKTGEKVFSRQNLISFFPKKALRFGKLQLQQISTILLSMYVNEIIERKKIQIHKEFLSFKG